MAKHSMPEMKEGGVNVTPLIDIVMCLIIFFMLVTKIGVKTGDDPTITPAETILGTSLKNIGDTFTLNIHNDSSSREPTVTAMLDDSGNAKPIPLNDPAHPEKRPLLEVLKELKSKNVALQLVLNVDADTPYSLTSQVYATIGEAGVEKIAFRQKQVEK